MPSQFESVQFKIHLKFNLKLTLLQMLRLRSAVHIGGTGSNTLWFSICNSLLFLYLILVLNLIPKLCKLLSSTKNDAVTTDPPNFVLEYIVIIKFSC